MPSRSRDESSGAFPGYLDAEAGCGSVRAEVVEGLAGQRTRDYAERHPSAMSPDGCDTPVTRTIDRSPAEVKSHRTNASVGPWPSQAAARAPGHAGAGSPDPSQNFQKISIPRFWRLWR